VFLLFGTTQVNENKHSGTYCIQQMIQAYRNDVGKPAMKKQLRIPDRRWGHINIFYNPILLAICASTFEHLVAEIVKVLCYKLECRGFESKKEVIGFFQFLPNPLSRTMILGFIQPQK
jgi:hypothetical protein